MSRPSLDPMCLQWLLFMMGHADQPLTPHEVAEAIPEFEWGDGALSPDRAGSPPPADQAGRPAGDRG